MINWSGSTLYIFSERPVFSSLWSHDHCLNSLFQEKCFRWILLRWWSSVSVCVIFFPLQKGGKSSSLRLIITHCNCLTKVPVALPRLMRESFYFPSLIYCLFILLHMLLDFSLQIYETFIPINFRCFFFLYIELDLRSFKLETQIQLFSDADYFWTFWTHFKCFKAVIL